MLYRTMISAAAELWEGAVFSDVADNPEYLRGQIELICALLGLSTDECRDSIRADIIAALALG